MARYISKKVANVKHRMGDKKAKFTDNLDIKMDEKEPIVSVPPSRPLTPFVQPTHFEHFDIPEVPQPDDEGPVVAPAHFDMPEVPQPDEEPVVPPVVPEVPQQDEELVDSQSPTSKLGSAIKEFKIVDELPKQLTHPDVFLTSLGHEEERHPLAALTDDMRPETPYDDDEAFLNELEHDAFG